MAEDQTSSGAQSPVEEDEALVESLIQGRGKRSTAGRHMSALLDAEADDDLALLFEEVDDDNEFDAAAEDEDEDMRLDSDSDDDEDQGPDAKGDEDVGEKELAKEARAERKKRRAKDDLRLKALRKKVKIDPTVSTVPPRPKKKSERISWLPTPEEGPTRSSSRRQTMQNKELTHARLKDSEERRVRLIATMEEAAKRKAQFKPKEWTQAEWLAEAARVERLNSKSLNRWEETEKRKADERRAKIEALQNRRLEGPVMSYWSGIATWIDGRLTRVGKAEITHKPKPEKDEPVRKRSKKTEKEDKSMGGPKPTEPVNTDAGPQPASLPAPAPDNATETITQDQGPVVTQSQNHDVKKDDTGPIAENDKLPERETSNGRPDETTPVNTTGDPFTKAPTPIENVAPGTRISPESAAAPAENETPKEAGEGRTAGDTSRRNSSFAVVIPTPKTSPKASEPKAERPPQSSPKVAEENPDSNQPLPPSGENHGVIPNPPLEEAPAGVNPLPETAAPVVPPDPPAAATATCPLPVTQQEGASAPEQQAPTPLGYPDQPPHVNGNLPHPRPPVVERTGRNLTILEDFDDETAQSREYSIYFNAKKPPRLTSMWACLTSEARC